MRARPCGCVACDQTGQPAVAMVDLIMESIGLVRNFEVLAGESDGWCGAYATFRDSMSRGLRPKLAYWKDGRTSWKSVGILAHEIGHNVLSHWLDGGSKPPTELEADFFSGFTVEKIGGTLRNALSWTAIASEEGSATHPPRNDRVRAVSLGWGSARMQRMAAQGDGSGWVGPEFDWEGRTCRMAFPVDRAERRPRLACRWSGDRWKWIG